MSSQTQDIDATSPDNGIILCADTAAGSCPRGTTRLFSRRAAQEDAGVSVQAHEDLVSEVLRLCESLARIHMHWINLRLRGYNFFLYQVQHVR